MKLSGKVCVVTGAGSGIGKATARLFAQEGGRLTVADVDAERARATGEDIRRAGGEAREVAGDVSRPDDVQRMLAETLRAFGRVDVLVNNAGFGFAATVEDTSEEDWDRIMAVNVKGVFLGCKYAVPLMRKQGGGVIVNTASVVSVVGIRNRAAYCASKGAVASLTKAMAIDHAQDGIRVNCIAPGTIDSPYFDRMFAASPDPKKLRQELEGRHIMNRLGTPEEIAKGMLYLACDDSSYVTGSTLLVDGGMTAW